MLAAQHDLRRVFVVSDNVDAPALFEHHAALPFHRIWRPAVVQACERALMRFRPAWAKSRVFAEHRGLGTGRCGAERGHECDETAMPHA